jgi:glycosyltransferase involved in cell wall biosynthesis/ribosomal protein S18 acetylase RimI-like enzyme
MKILWVKTDFLHPTTRGGQIRTLEILARLHARHQIHYVAFDDPKRPEGPERSVEYCSQAYPVPHAVPRKGSPGFIPQLVKGLFSRLPVAVGRYRSAAMARRIEALLERHRFDRLVCDFLAPAPNLTRLRDWVLFQHNVESAIWSRRADRARDPFRALYLRLQARRMHDYEGRACREAGRVLAVSRQDADLMRTLYGAFRIAVVPTGVDVDRFSPPPHAPKVADLVFVGSMDWLPNIDGMIFFAREILPRIRRERPGCSVAIVGRSPARAVSALAARDPRIVVTGTVEDVRPYLWGSSVAIVPLRIGGGTRLKIYEAMAAGVPVVSTAIGAEGLDVKSPENIRLADDPEGFAGACVELLVHDEVRRGQARAGLELVRARASWDAAAAVFEAALRDAGPPGSAARERGDFAFAELERGDLDAACALLSRLSVSFAGVVSPAMSRAICAEAIRRRDPVIVVAKEGGRVVGLALAVRHGSRFRRAFPARHPLLALRAAARRLLEGRGGGRKSRPPDSGGAPVSGPSWSDGEEGIAKVMFIGVAPEHRRAGLAGQLYGELFARLRARGARRIDARIEPDNRASLRLHEASGWTLRADGGGVFATRPLEQTDA